MDPNFLPWLFLKQFYPLIVIILLVLFKYITCLQVAVTYLIFCCYWYFLPNNKLLYNKTNTVISSILKSGSGTITSRAEKSHLPPNNVLMAPRFPLSISIILS